MLAKIASLRSLVRERFGKVVTAMIMLPRWRQQTLADLQHFVLEPLIRDRVAAAQRAGTVYPPARWNRPVQNRPHGPPGFEFLVQPAQAWCWFSAPSLPENWAQSAPAAGRKLVSQNYINKIW